jgi:hypothetical protein
VWNRNRFVTRVARKMIRVEQKQVCNKSSTTGDTCRTVCYTRVTCRAILVTNLFLFYTCHLSCYSCYKPVSVLHVSPVVLLLLQTCFCSTRVTCRATLVTNLLLFYTCHMSCYSCLFVTKVSRQVTRVKQKQVCKKSSTKDDTCRTETGL